MSKWERLPEKNIVAKLPRKAWARSDDLPGAIYKCEDGYRIYCWFFLKGYKYKYLKEAKAVLEILCRLGDIPNRPTEQYMLDHFEIEDNWK